MICFVIMITESGQSGMNLTAFKCSLGSSKKFLHSYLERIIDMMLFSLQQIVDLDEKNQILTSNIWLTLQWNDDGLVWNESEYGGITV